MISASVRKSESLYDAPAQGSRRRPATVTFPCASCSVARAWSSTISASGAAPPYCPLCFGPASVRTSTVTTAVPRSATVSVGTPGVTLPMSAISIASQRNRPGSTGG
jgi:hypothetical protein